MFIANLPPALPLEVLWEVAAQDEVYQRLRVAVKKGRKPADRNKVQDLSITDKYLEGKAMPCDCTSRHGVPNEGRDKEEKERQRVDNSEDIQVR